MARHSLLEDRELSLKAIAMIKGLLSKNI